MATDSTDSLERTPASASDPVPPESDPVRPDSDPAATPPRWCLYTRLLLAAGAGWLVLLLLQYALSGRWWAMMALNLEPPVAFLAVPLLLLAGVPAPRLARRRMPRRPALAVTVLALAGLVLGYPWSGLNPAALWEGDSTAPPGALRVVSLNTLAWGKSTTPDRFYQALKSRNADVYLLQEYVWSDQDDANERQIDDMARIRREFPQYHVAVQGELVTLSRYPIVSRPPIGPYRVTSSGESPDWYDVYRTGKVLRTDIRVRGRVVSMYNVHIPVQVDMRESFLTPAFYRVIHDREAARRAQYKGLLDDIGANRNPLLVAGDFNTTAAMGDLRPLRSKLDDAADHGGSVLPISWNEQGRLRLWRLDWTFTSGGLDTHRYALTALPEVSDHRLQETVVSVRESR
ncbi:endonuclease/exonuclease/phosphatase family protein [Streptomyces sp. WI04-05B]|uniref:endonuclease/exonuclease/phosphatase family protein n=1 Tax=Streptomyces TaxID=1883 RepID=UPI0029A437C0|nr:MULTISPECIES: endonuclease/exonuclease/phosphatase family protein [unclassified Streptomyces]MDX2542804.1 endonuclease/exonuclease/phosphatase family protein [Streptomyces sp. WI04-05B]MDX2588348.1 endonuclease/exonuclease/phosphatase family protein [Streptomyces sp. WI04-05A]